jgi:hypothetical protein
VVEEDEKIGIEMVDGMLEMSDKIAKIEVSTMMIDLY